MLLTLGFSFDRACSILWPNRKDLRMTMTSRVQINNNMTDGELRNAVHKNPDNGSYANKICRNCGFFETSDTGDPFTAKITNECRNCPRDENFKLLVGQEKFSSFS